MQSAAELLKKHMLVLHCGLPTVSPSSYSWGNIANTHTFGNEHTSWASSLWNPLQGIMKCKCSSDITSETQHKMHNTSTKTHTRQDMHTLIRTFLRHAGIPGIVSLLRRLIAHRVATFGPPQDTERPVQPPEGTTPHWRTVKVSDCRGDRREREAQLKITSPSTCPDMSESASLQPIKCLLVA